MVLCVVVVTLSETCAPAPYRALNCCHFDLLCRTLRARATHTHTHTHAAEVVSAVPGVLAQVGWPAVWVSLVRFLSFVNLDVLRLISPSCVVSQDHYTALLGATVVPVLVLLALAAGKVVLGCKWDRPAEREWLRTRAFNAALVFT